MNSNNKRQAFLQAAERIVTRDGVAKLTLDAVALEAGVSKGGVLYHFPKKNALIEGMIGAWIEQFDDHQICAYEEDTRTPGRWLRAYVRACARDTEGIPWRESSVGLLAAISNTPELMDTVRKKFEFYQSQCIQDGFDEVTATVIRLAADGLWLADLLGLEPPRGELRKQIVVELLAMASSLDEPIGDPS